MISFHRLYHASCVAFSFKKQALKLCKSQWHPTQAFAVNALPSVKSLTQQKHEPGNRGQHRTAMLNNIFMKQINDLTSTGTAALDIVGRGIDISKVNVTPDMNTVNVFWVCKDKQEAHFVDLGRRLAMIDYGDHYVPTDMGHLLKSEFTLNTQLSPEVKTEQKRLYERMEDSRQVYKLLEEEEEGADEFADDDEYDENLQESFSFYTEPGEMSDPVDTQPQL